MAVKETPIPDFKEADTDDEQHNDPDLDEVGASFEDDPDEEAKDEAKSEDEAEDDTSDFEDDDDSEDEAKDEEADAEAEAEKPKAEQSDEERQKAHNREMAEKRLQAKAQRDAGIKQQQDDYLADADPEDPRDIAVRQLQIDAYNNKVEANTNKLTNGYERAVKDFPILTDSSPEVQREVSQAIDAFQAMHVTIDKFGNPTGVRGDLYAYLQAKADSITALTGRGARQQSQNKTKERSKVMSPPSRPPREAKKDADLDAFDEEAGRW
jgi:hypothetical protein